MNTLNACSTSTKGFLAHHDFLSFIIIMYNNTLLLVLKAALSDELHQFDHCGVSAVSMY